MKKFLLLLVAIILMAGTAYASAPIIIPGNPFQPIDPRNESYITQTGTLSWAMVTQYGDQSKSLIYQATQWGSDKAVVTQGSPCCGFHACYGCGFFGWLEIPLFTEAAYQNLSKITQTGFGWHDAYVNQYGDGNKSTISQTGANDLAMVNQIGSFNESVITQTGYGIDKAYVSQVGDLNKSYIYQADGVNTANVAQNGFGNVSAIYQNSYFGVNTALVNQLGYMNLSMIYQASCGFHTAIVNQTNFCYSAKVASCF